MFSIRNKYGFQFFEAAETLNVDALEIGSAYDIVTEEDAVVSVASHSPHQLKD
jgi:hypothetical protein